MGNRLKRKQKVAAQRKFAQQGENGADHGVIGMLYLVDVRMVNKRSGEKIKKKLLLVGCEADDIERKLRWVFDSSLYEEFSVSDVEKVREKVHVISTVYSQLDTTTKTPLIKRTDGTPTVKQMSTGQEKYDPNLYAVGITTTMIGKDEQHALRKVGNAILASATDGKSHSAAELSEDATVTVERIPFQSGYAMPRDVTNESNKPHFVRG